MCRVEVEDELPLAARDALASLLLAALATGETDGPDPLAEAAALLELPPDAAGACAAATAHTLARAGLAEIDPGAASDGRAVVRRRAVPWASTARARLASYVAAASRAPRGSDRASRLGQAAALLPAGLFFEVHEVLEPAWRQAVGRERVALQGVIQAAVAWHHWRGGRPAAARRLAQAASDKLKEPLPEWRELPLDELRALVERWASWLAAGATGAEPPLPR